MSIEQDGREIAISCDRPRCHEETGAFDRDDFHRMVAEAKRNGWLIENRRGQYFHTCPVCASELDFDGFDTD